MALKVKTVFDKYINETLLYFFKFFMQLIFLNDTLFKDEGQILDVRGNPEFSFLEN